MGTPGRYHPLATKLATLTGGRCLSFRYRLAPQNPFPAALLDCLVCYLSLLYPPPGSFHESAPASSIVFAGDSAGACLALALTQLLLSTQSSKVNFHGRSVELPLPSGIAVLSAGLDFTLALPSWMKFAANDIFFDTWSMLDPNYTPCSVWPANPPRGHPYCEISMMDHPLTAPMMASNWRGAPPMWFAGGQERFADSAKVAAEQAARQGVSVRYEEYEEMPHDFPILSLNWPWAVTDEWPQSIKCIDNWVNACKTFVKGRQQDSGAVLYLTDGGEERLDVENLTGLTFGEVKRLVREKKAQWKSWLGNSAGKAAL
ncbi:MAG: hypothetical protein MMC33_006022 [Icmadophila ericetorum]|nr:hypothetical protein [Icmadophila ericetorum]